MPVTKHRSVGTHLDRATLRSNILVDGKDLGVEQNFLLQIRNPWGALHWRGWATKASVLTVSVNVTSVEKSQWKAKIKFKLRANSNVKSERMSVQAPVTTCIASTYVVA